MTASTTQLLRRLVDEPQHVRAVRALEPRRFVSLVRAVGLEDAGELLAMATPEQTLEVLDTQLWRAGPSDRSERLDAERFVVWLQVLLEAGDEAAARRLREIPEELLTAGLSAQLFVLELDALGHGLAGASWDEAEVAERVLDETLHLELDGYTLVARSDLGWDACIAALLALDVVDHDRVQRILERCRQATAEELEDEDDGLHPILRAQETIEVDAHADREDRRSQQGYVSLADARAFLALADQTALDDVDAVQEDPVTRAALRELRPAPARGKGRGVAAAVPAPTPVRGTLRALVERAEEELGEATRARAALPAGRSELPVEAPEPEPESEVVVLREALQELAAEHPLRHGEQLTRLAYLANLLVTAGHPDGNPYAPVEAGDEVLRRVALGLRHHARRLAEAEATVLLRVGVDGLFRLGWRLAPPPESIPATRAPAPTRPRSKARRGAGRAR